MATREPEPKSLNKVIGEKEDWQATSILTDFYPQLSSKKSFNEVFEDRRTRRTISAVSLQETCAFIAHVFSPRRLGKGRSSGLLRKSMISAGALHPIDVLIVGGSDIEEPVLFSDSYLKFLTVPILNETGLQEAIDEVSKILPRASGHMILFAGDKRRVSTVYRSPEPLLWRDGGAASQACSMAAYATDYRFCPMGYSGSAILSAIGPPHGDFVALGLGMFGR